MTDLLVGLPLVCLIAFASGAGWAAVFYRSAPYGALGLIFLAWACAIATTSIVWAWAYPFNQDARFAVWAFVVLSGVGYVVALWRNSFHRLDLHGSIRPLAGILLCASITLIAVLPAVADLRHLSVGQRIGPDAVGYAVSAQAMGSGLTRSAIEHELAAQLIGGTVATALTPKTEQVDKIPSVTIQVRNEFLTGADRWGLTGVVGSTVFLVGGSHLWSALSLFTAFALLTTLIGVWVVIRSLTRSAWAALASAILLGMSPSVLNSWHEGGLAQIWVMPAALLLALPIIRLDGEDGIGPAAALGVAIMLPAYNADMVASIAVLMVAMVLSIAVVRHAWWRYWGPVALGGAVGAVLVAPSTAAFAATFLRSLQENGIAGWPQPRWSSPTDVIGLRGIYNSPYPVVGQRSSTELVLESVGNAVVGALLIGMVYRVRLRMSTILLASVIFVLVAVYVQSRYLHPTSNYQYFKAIVAMAPAGVLGFGIVLGDALKRNQSSELAPTRRVRRPSPLALWITSMAVIIGVVVSGITYVAEYRQQGSVVPIAYTELAGSAQAQAEFKRYNVVMPGTPAGVAVAAEVNLNWIGRFGVPETRLSSRMQHPVALLVTETTCPRFACLARLRPGTVAFRQGGIALVQLSATTVPLSRIRDVQWPAWVADRFSSIGGGTLVGMTPITNQN